MQMAGRIAGSLFQLGHDNLDNLCDHLIVIKLS